MLNVALLKDGYLGSSPLVGWKQNQDTSGVQLTSMTTSSSGIWFGGSHPLITIDNLISVMPQRIKNMVAGTEKNEQFTTWLKDQTEDAIVEVLTQYLDEKTIIDQSGAFLAEAKLFTPYLKERAFDVSEGDFVGRWIRTFKSESLMVTIDSIDLQFEQDGEIELRVFEVGKNEPVFERTINYLGAGRFQTIEIAPFSLEGGKDYFIAYDQNEIAGRSVNFARNRTPNCNYFYSKSFSVSASSFDEMWDLGDVQYGESTNYGLGFNYTVQCDFSSFLIKNKHSFKSVVQLYVDMKILALLKSNPNALSNRNENNIDRGAVQVELYGDSQGRYDFSLHGKFKKAINAVKVDFRGVDSYCLRSKKSRYKHKPFS